MSTSTLVILIVVLSLITVLCVRTRAALPALVSGGLVVLLVCGAWSGLAPAISNGIQSGGDAASSAVSAVSGE